jgi:DNA-binding MarR family transcriptional regulator
MRPHNNGSAVEALDSPRPGLTQLLLQASRRLESELYNRLQGSEYGDVRPSHGAVFGNIDASGTQPVDLARRAGMTKQSMGELIQDLEQKGYVRREVVERDKRHRLVVLSERGRAYQDHVRQLEDALEQDYAREIGKRAFDSLRSGLARLREQQTRRR